MPLESQLMRPHLPKVGIAMAQDMEIHLDTDWAPGKSAFNLFVYARNAVTGEEGGVEILSGDPLPSESLIGEIPLKELFRPDFEGLQPLLNHMLADRAVVVVSRAARIPGGITMSVTINRTMWEIQIAPESSLYKVFLVTTP